MEGITGIYQYSIIMESNEIPLEAKRINNMIPLNFMTVEGIKLYSME